MDSLKRLGLIMKAKSDPRFFIHSNYFLGDMPAPYPLQETLFVEFFVNHYKEFVGVGGMGGGKTFLGSLFSCYDLFDLLMRENPAKDYGLASHSKIFLLCIAKSDEQASDTIYAEVSTKIANSPFFQEFSPKIKEYNTTFLGHPDVEILALGASSAGSAVGRNVKSIVFDEISSYDETQSQRGSWQVYTRLRKSTNRFGFDGHVIAISSPWHVNDIIMSLARKALDNPKTLARVFTTWDMNPNKQLDSPEMKAELSRDPITFWRDYGVEPHSSIMAYYPDLTIIKMNEKRQNILEPGDKPSDAFGKLSLADPHQTYVLAIDPALVNDAFGIALLHKEGKRVIADGLWRFVPPETERVLNPVELKHYLLNLVKSLPIRYLITDQWYYVEALTEIERLGVQIVFKPNRKEEHDKVRNAFFEDTLELCYYPRIIDEFSQLLVLDSRRIGIIRNGKIDVVDALTRGYWAFAQQLISLIPPNVVEVI
jgi:hypothetical protein